MRAALVRPAARTVSWPTVGGLVALGAAPVALNAPRARPSLGAAVVVVVVLCGVTAACAVGEPAREVLDATPVGAAPRLSARLAIVAALAGVVGVAVVAIARWRDAHAITSVPARLAELFAAAGLALALAALADRRRVDSAGWGGALGAVLVMLVSSGLAMRVRRLPSLGLDHHAHRWWVVAAVAWAVAWWARRDPYVAGPIQRASGSEHSV